jgi:hypothetical protein
MDRTAFQILFVYFLDPASYYPHFTLEVKAPLLPLSDTSFTIPCPQ